MQISTSVGVAQDIWHFLRSRHRALAFASGLRRIQQARALAGAASLLRSTHRARCFAGPAECQQIGHHGLYRLIVLVERRQPHPHRASRGTQLRFLDLDDLAMEPQGVAWPRTEQAMLRAIISERRRGTVSIQRSRLDRIRRQFRMRVVVRHRYLAE
jgi:hypothetical protein